MSKLNGIKILLTVLVIISLAGVGVATTTADKHPLIAIGELDYGQKKLARTSDGAWHAVYSRSDGSYSQIYHSYSNDGGETWTEEQITTASNNHRYSSIAIDSNDRIHVAWSYCQEPSGPGKTCTIQYRAKTATWQPIENVIISYGAVSSLAVNSQNNVHLVVGGSWGGAYNCDCVEYLKRTSSGWSSPEIKSVNGSSHVQYPQARIQRIRIATWYGISGIFPLPSY
ncbi:MAG: sialidase family protein [Candidatus Methanoperedens sp.]|nr:sialidase family protein [Candidatus Methanoperedens sp.]